MGPSDLYAWESVGALNPNAIQGKNLEKKQILDTFVYPSIYRGHITRPKYLGVTTELRLHNRISPDGLSPSVVHKSQILESNLDLSSGLYPYDYTL